MVRAAEESTCDRCGHPSWLQHHKEGALEGRRTEAEGTTGTDMEGHVQSVVTGLSDGRIIQLEVTIH